MELKVRLSSYLPKLFCKHSLIPHGGECWKARSLVQGPAGSPGLGRPHRPPLGLTGPWAERASSPSSHCLRPWWGWALALTQLGVSRPLPTELPGEGQGQAPASCPCSPVPPTPAGRPALAPTWGMGPEGRACKGGPQVSGLARPHWASSDSLAGREGVAHSRVMGLLAILWGAPNPLGNLSELGTVVRGFW